MFKYTLHFLLVFTLCFQLSISLAKDQPWFFYTSPNKHLSVEFPNPPKTSSVNRTEYTAYSISAEAKDVTYKIIYTVHDEPLSAADQKLFLENTKTMFINAKNGKIKSENKVTIAGNLGLQVSFSTPDKYYVNYRLFFDKQTLYTLSVVAKKKYASKKDVKRFFESFALNATTETVAPSDPMQETFHKKSSEDQQNNILK